MEGEQSQEEKINKHITLRKTAFSRSQGIFHLVYKGALTDIVKKFVKKSSQEDPSDSQTVVHSQNDILQLLIERDEAGRTPFDLACFLGFKNIALYLKTNMGTPQDVINQEINVDTQNRNAYHQMCFRGNVDCMIAILNIERVYLKKTLFDQLLREKNRYRFKNMDIKHGQLAKEVFHDAETVKRHEDFNIRVHNLFEQYAKDIVDRYRQILTCQDIHKRNPIHYGAMSKYTKCYRTLEVLLTINIDTVPFTE